MRYRKLGATGLLISEIGVGCASYWGKAIFDERQAIDLVHAAAAHGVNFFDTGSNYSGGNAEPRLGRALAQMGAKRHDMVAATKAGTRLNRLGGFYKDFSPAGIRQSVEQSLRHLGLDSLRLLQLHAPRLWEFTDELLAELARLRHSGKVQTLGVSSFDMAVIGHTLTLPLFTVVMIDYNILQPEWAPLIEQLAARDFGILAGMAMAGGLTDPGRFLVRRPRDLWYVARVLKNHRAALRRARGFRFLYDDGIEQGNHQVLGWVLENPLVSTAMIGTTRMAHLEQNLGASGYVMPQDILARIARVQAEF